MDRQAVHEAGEDEDLLPVEVDGEQHQAHDDRLGAAPGADIHHQGVVQPQTRGQPGSGLATEAVTPEDGVDQIPGQHVAQREQQLAHVGTTGDIGHHHVRQEGAVPVGVSVVRRVALVHMPGRVREDFVVHVSVLDLHGLILMLAVSDQDQPQEHRECHVSGDAYGLNPFFRWQHDL